MRRHPFVTRAAVVPAAAILLVLPLLAPLTGAGTVWSEGVAEFAGGAKESLNLGPGGLSLGAVNGTMVNRWTRLAFGDPARRYGAATAYDITHDEVVLFGGEAMPGDLDDTWTYNLSRNSWTNMDPPAAPPARHGHAMAYDNAHDEVVLFGGFDGNFLCDTWAYNLRTNTWTNMNPPTYPPARFEHAMAYDSARGLVILFGGNAGASFLNDTWTYDVYANVWTNRTATAAPSPRYFHAMAYDSGHDRVVLFGGYHGILPAMGDTWTYDPGANTWTEMSPSAAPAGRYSQTMDFDSVRGDVVMFGGYLGTWPLLGDTWTYDCGANAWTEKKPPGAPSPRYEQTMAYDSLHGMAVLFGGLNFTYLGDTWTYDLGTNLWTDRKPATAPPARCDHAMVYDDAYDRAVLFGGFDGYDYLNDTWTFDLRTNIWTNMDPPEAPPARRYHAMAYDSVHEKVVLFGGFNGSSLGDTWTYDLGGNTWTNVSPPFSPLPRNHHAMVYDIARGEVLMVGGYGLTYDNGTWTYNLTTNSWTGRSLSTWGTIMHAMAYDPVHDVTVMFGGGMDFGNSTFTYDPVTGNWTDMHPARSPPGRYGHAMAYDRAAGGVVLFGGFGYGHILGDTWTYDLSANSWTNMSPPAAPSVRYSHAMVFDSGRGGVVLFGGLGDNYFSDTWAYDQLSVSPAGAYTSAPRDAGGAAYFGAMSWDAVIPSCTTLRFQLRGSDTAANLAASSFLGPDGTAGTYYETGGQRMSSAHNGSRWLQYRAYFRTEDINNTPVLSRVVVSYNLIHGVELASPRGGESWDGVQTVSWNASDPDGDALLFDLYLVDAKNKTTLLAANLNGKSCLWNASGVAEGAYQIKVVARDNNPSIPLTVNATSGGFKVFHAAPNGPPSAALVSPANLSIVTTTNVTLIWKGYDPDNDPISYNVTWACGTFNRPDRQSIVTKGTSRTLTDMANNTAYFWAVTPSDGKESGAQTPVWSFNVNLSGPAPVNHPPIITSAPPLTARAGEEYVYNVTAEDPDGDPLAFSLIMPPAGMGMDRVSGRLNWTPPETGNFTVTVMVSDGLGGVYTQTFTVRVFAPGTRPVCVITSPPDGSTVSGKINITGLAVKGASPLERVEVRIDGGNWQSVSGLESWRIILNTPDLANGMHAIEARAYGGTDYSDNARVRITVNNASPNIRPDGQALTMDWLPCVVLALLFMVAVIMTALCAGGKIRQYQERGRPPVRRTE